MAGIHNVLIGADGAKQVTINVLSGTNNYVLNTAKVSGYVPGSANVTLVINSGVTIGSTSTSQPALSVDSSWAPGDVITIINNGLIIGKGGKGGNGSAYPSYGTWPTPGESGGAGLLVSYPVTITNNGTIGGGGGGGGGGCAVGFDQTTLSGGGGGGAGFGSRGIGRQTIGTSTEIVIAAGSASTSGSSISGGAGEVTPTIRVMTESDGPTIIKGGSGGNGGGLGAPGGSGGPASNSLGIGGWRDPNNRAGAGGAGGPAVSGNSNITWITTGTRLGAIV